MMYDFKYIPLSLEAFWTGLTWFFREQEVPLAAVVSMICNLYLDLFIADAHVSRFQETRLNIQNFKTGLIYFRINFFTYVVSVSKDPSGRPHPEFASKG